ncbi:unnamed protein product [Prorocentrum cordatum]|uniref:Protein HIRA n=1 Tax=Prorocentrum cordatum TaxID=2364126 RepID=A0ABN9TV22_9DINO|nr:unnamed protein product [Polarella glacialis]
MCQDDGEQQPLAGRAQGVQDGGSARHRRTPLAWNPEATSFSADSIGHAVAWSPSGTTIATGRGDKDTRIWQASEANPALWTSVVAIGGPQDYVTALGWSPDGGCLLTGNVDSRVRIWASAGTAPVQWEVLATLRGHSSPVTAVAWSPDGGRIASGDCGRSVRIWERSGESLERWAEVEVDPPAAHSGGVTAVAWSPQGDALLTGGGDKAALVWQATDEEGSRWVVAATLAGHAAAVVGVSWAPDGRAVATASEDRTARVWRATDPEMLSWEVAATLPGHGSKVTAVAWSPDGLRLVTGGGDQRIRVWQASGDAWDVVATLLAEEEPEEEAAGQGRVARRTSKIGLRSEGGIIMPTDVVTAAGWSPDGTKIIAGCGHASTYVWQEGRSGWQRRRVCLGRGTRRSGAPALSPPRTRTRGGGGVGAAEVGNEVPGVEDFTDRPSMAWGAPQLHIFARELLAASAGGWLSRPAAPEGPLCICEPRLECPACSLGCAPCPERAVECPAVVCQCAPAGTTQPECPAASVPSGKGWSLSLGLGGWGLLPLAFLAGRLTAGCPRREGTMARAPDIHETMVAINFDDDDHFRWHVRILAHRLDDLRWVALSPDLEVLVLDLSRHLVVPVARGAPFPARIAGDVYSSDRFDEAALQAARQVVPVEITRNALRMVIKGSAGLAEVEENGERFWTFVERVANQDVEDWREEKTSGRGRDARILPIQRDMGRSRFAKLKDALSEMTFLEDPPPADWPFAGPQAIKEVLVAARAANEDLTGFHEHWVRLYQEEEDKRKGSTDKGPKGGKEKAFFRYHYAFLRWRRAEVAPVTCPGGGAGSRDLKSWALTLETPSRLSSQSITPAQDGALNNIGRAVAHFLPTPDFTSEFPEGALQEIIKCKSIYDIDDDSTVASYDPEKLAVLHRPGAPVPALELVGEECRPYLEDPDSLIVLPPLELAAIEDPVVPHWDPKLGGSQEARRDFVDRLSRVGLISWRRRERCRVGAFFAKKKNDAIRLVLDCRPTNQLHRKPPKSDLATPGALSNLVLAEEWCRLSADDLPACDKGSGSIDQLDLSCAGMDLKDGFYQFRADSVARFAEAVVLRRWTRAASACCPLPPRRRRRWPWRALRRTRAWPRWMCGLQVRLPWRAPCGPPGQYGNLGQKSVHRRAFGVRARRYEAAYADVVRFLGRCVPSAKSLEAWDRALEDYIEKLYLAGDRITVARYAFHGVAFVNEWPRRDPSLLPRSRLALLGFARSSPEHCRDPPCMEQVYLAIDYFIGRAAGQDLLLYAMAAAHAWISVDCYLRTGSLEVGQDGKDFHRHPDELLLHGERPLHECAKMNAAACAKMLIGAGAAVDALDAEGATPAEHAARAKHRGVLEILVMSGALLGDDLVLPASSRNIQLEPSTEEASGRSRCAPPPRSTPPRRPGSAWCPQGRAPRSTRSTGPTRRTYGPSGSMSSTTG